MNLKTDLWLLTLFSFQVTNQLYNCLGLTVHVMSGLDWARPETAVRRENQGKLTDSFTLNKNISINIPEPTKSKSYVKKRGTVLPWFTRLLWQIKNRVNQNSRYTSPSMDKMIVQKMSKKFL